MIKVKDEKPWFRRSIFACPLPMIIAGISFPFIHFSTATSSWKLICYCCLTMDIISWATEKCWGLHSSQREYNVQLFNLWAANASSPWLTLTEIMTKFGHLPIHPPLRLTGISEREVFFILYRCYCICINISWFITLIKGKNRKKGSISKLTGTAF